MKYNELRETARTGDIFFTASYSLFSRLIRLFTRSRVSHTGVFVWAEILGEQRLLTAEVLEGVGFRLHFASSRYLEDEFYFGRPNIDVDEKKVAEKILGNSFAKYDLRGAIASIFFDTKTPDKLFCSEFVADVLGVRFDASKRGVTPDDLTKICTIFREVL